MTRPPGSGGAPDDRDDRDDPDDRNVEGPTGLIQSLLALLQEMEERGERTRSGHSRPGPNTSVDFSVSVGGLTGPGGTPPFGTRDEGTRGQDGDTDESASDPHVTTRETESGLVVAADLPGVDESAVQTRLDPDADVLIIEVSGRDAARLPLQSEGWTVVDSRFSNGVLEVELSRD